MTILTFQGESKLSNTPDTDGMTILDALYVFCGVAFAFPMFIGTNYFATFLNNGLMNPNGVHVPDWMAVGHGSVLAVLSMISMFGLFAYSIIRRLNRTRVVFLKVECGGDTLISRVQEALRAVRCGRFELKTADDDVTRGRLMVYMPASDTAADGTIQKALVAAGVVVKTV